MNRRHAHPTDHRPSHQLLVAARHVAALYVAIVAAIIVALALVDVR